MNGELELRVVHVGDQVWDTGHRLHVAVRQIAPQADRVLELILVRLAVASHSNASGDRRDDQNREHRPEHLARHLPLPLFGLRPTQAVRGPADPRGERTREPPSRGITARNDRVTKLCARLEVELTDDRAPCAHGAPGDAPCACAPPLPLERAGLQVDVVMRLRPGHVDRSNQVGADRRRECV